MQNQLSACFKEKFGTDHEAMYFSPGRINLIGEHIDYNGGSVFPCAITLGTYGVVRKRSDKTFRLYSKNFEDLGQQSFQLDDLTYKKEHQWINYVKGVVKVLLEKGYEIASGIDLLVYGNLPNGAGLSSSASLEMLTLKILIDCFNLTLTPQEAALIGKEVENTYIGVASGIMDQFAIALGKEECALLLNCDTMAYRYIPCKIKGHSIIIMNTNKRRELADSKYNERRQECEDALQRIQRQRSINALCDLEIEALQEFEAQIQDATLYKRARHVVSENDRVKKAVKALEEGDLKTFGKLLNASHTSLKEDYEVTGKELDTLVEAAWQQPGVLGARMTGAGFGGCSLAIVEEEKVEAFIKEVGATYLEKIGYEASFYEAFIGGAPNIIK